MQIFGFETNDEWVKLLTAAGILVFFVALALLSRIFLKGIVRLAAGRTKTKLDDIVIQALVRPVFAALILAGLWLALARIPELSSHLDVVHQVATILFIGIVVMAVVRVVNALLLWYSVEVAPRTKTDVDNKVIPLLRRISTVIIYAIGLLVILDQLNVNISPILASLGIGGLAVALALQPTLSNFLAGTYVISDTVVNVGDYIMLDSGQEGLVEDIGWRSTKLRSWQENLIILPNSRLAEAIVTDYEKPEKAMLFAVDCGVSYDSDLNTVEQVTIDVAQEILQKFPQGVKNFQPVVRFKHFGDSNIDFAVVLKSVDRAGHYVIKHEFIKALHKRFGEEGIEIQYPTRKLYLADSQSTHPSDIVQRLTKKPETRTGE